jgi:hypothetical protein
MSNDKVASKEKMIGHEMLKDFINGTTELNISIEYLYNLLINDFWAERMDHEIIFGNKDEFKVEIQLIPRIIKVIKDKKVKKEETKKEVLIKIKNDSRSINCNKIHYIEPYWVQYLVKKGFLTIVKIKKERRYIPVEGFEDLFYVKMFSSPNGITVKTYMKQPLFRYISEEMEKEGLFHIPIRGIME